MSKLLSDQEIRTQLQSLQGWSKDGLWIITEKKFNTFSAAIAFVNKIAELAEAASHHPEIHIHYNQVLLELSTHDAGGLTEKDFSLAQKINAL